MNVLKDNSFVLQYLSILRAYLMHCNSFSVTTCSYLWINMDHIFSNSNWFDWNVIGFGFSLSPIHRIYKKMRTAFLQGLLSLVFLELMQSATEKRMNKMKTRCSHDRGNASKMFKIKKHDWRIFLSNCAFTDVSVFLSQNTRK